MIACMFGNEHTINIGIVTSLTDTQDIRLCLHIVQTSRSISTLDTLDHKEKLLKT